MSRRKEKESKPPAIEIRVFAARSPMTCMTLAFPAAASRTNKVTCSEQPSSSAGCLEALHNAKGWRQLPETLLLSHAAPFRCVKSSKQRHTAEALAAGSGTASSWQRHGKCSERHIYVGVKATPRLARALHSRSSSISITSSVTMQEIVRGNRRSQKIHLNIICMRKNYRRSIDIFEDLFHIYVSDSLASPLPRKIGKIAQSASPVG